MTLPTRPASAMSRGPTVATCTASIWKAPRAAWRSDATFVPISHRSVRTARMRNLDVCALHAPTTAIVVASGIPSELKWSDIHRFGQIGTSGPGQSDTSPLSDPGPQFGTSRPPGEAGRPIPSTHSQRKNSCRELRRANGPIGGPQATRGFSRNRSIRKTGTPFPNLCDPRCIDQRSALGGRLSAGGLRAPSLETSAGISDPGGQRGGVERRRAVSSPKIVQVAGSMATPYSRRA